MEGTGDGAFDIHWQAPNVSAHVDSIRNALSATLNPRISNERRQEALQHLESLKQQPDAPQYGFTLADDYDLDPAIRYFGLQLLEFSVRYRWTGYGQAQIGQIITWVKCLAGSLRQQDAAFLRNKVAQLWVEVAKRCWGSEWMDMDALLLGLWERDLQLCKGPVHKIFVLEVLGLLSEDVMVVEDAVAGLRLDVLGAALNEIVLPQAFFEVEGSKRKRLGFAEGSQGWCGRLCEFAAACVKQARMGQQAEVWEECATKALTVLRSVMGWISIDAAVEVGCVDAFFLPFHGDAVAMQVAASETLLALLSREYRTHWHESWARLQQSAMSPERVGLLRQAFDAAACGPGEDDAKYTLRKKLSELLSVLADGLAQHPDRLISDKLDLPAFFDLLLYVLQSTSLVISIPVLHSWSKMMPVQENTIIDLVSQALGTLVQTCSERLLRYENLPTDSEDEVVMFLDEDFDTVPERHAFLGNYRRYCSGIIQAIGRTRPIEALQHVLGQMRQMLQAGPYRGMNTGSWSRNALSVLQFDAQFNVVASALKGFSLWCADVQALGQDDALLAKVEADRTSAEGALREWCYGVIAVSVDDPEVASAVLQILVMVLRTVKPSSDFVLHVVQHLFTIQINDVPAHQAYSDAVKSFEVLRVVELQKLALAHADELLDVYSDLEPRVNELAERHSDQPRLIWGYKAFLFMIIHRATSIERTARMARLQQMLKPVYDAWSDPSLSSAVSSLQNCCEMLGTGDLAEFYKTYRFDQIQDWSAQQLDEAGQAKQQGIKDLNDALPLRMTKTMLSATTERLQPSSEDLSIASALWEDIIPTILPSLLQMIRQAQAFHNMSNWSHLPPELQVVVKRTLQDRFWQSGISNESKEDFYARISGSKASYEGFASVVRGTMRNLREQGYHILYLMTKFDERFYSIPDLTTPLAEVLFRDAECLSANHLHPLINLATGLVSRCPSHYRRQFLPPLLIQLFTKLDAKVSAEWESIGAANESRAGEDEELGDEMRTESVLRQLTFSMVSFVAFLLEFDRQHDPALANHTNGHAHSPSRSSLNDLVLSDPTILEPMLLFCTHALRMRDTRCCTTITRVFRTIIPLFTSTTAPAPQVREFICTEVLKACITSLHEPYFADMQKDLAALIAHIINLYQNAQLTDTPRQVLLSLPDMSERKIEKAFAKIAGKGGSERQQRAVVLDLLDGVRGVSIYEAGKVGRDGGQKKNGVAQQYMEVNREGIEEGQEVGLEGVAGLFGEG
ncbi:hypothetical protein LTR62_003362 [Meristemomyces frigidus]|uniref:Importin N-terminal domain-containing protein n=1 Tax=Meristemomyces frigidus TaxID=1508187 RepID=A0AAN7YRT7_9PEZI|nr:hypothetical protein LTR62_003362 [Meristemomyces frigidus]